jgi:hypothetical protein
VGKSGSWLLAIKEAAADSTTSQPASQHNCPSHSMACAQPPFHQSTHPVTHPPRQLLDLCRDGRQPLAVGVLHNGHHQADGRLQAGRAGRQERNTGQRKVRQSQLLAALGAHQTGPVDSTPPQLPALPPPQIKSLAARLQARSTYTTSPLPRLPPTHLHRDAAVHCVVLADELREPGGVHLGHLAQSQGRGLQRGGFRQAEGWGEGPAARKSHRTGMHLV